MRYVDFKGFYENISRELDLAESTEGILIERHPDFPVRNGEYVTREENVKGAIDHLREAVKNLDCIGPQLTERIDVLEARYQKLAERDRTLYNRLTDEFRISLGVAISLLEHARGQYFFFRGEAEGGYSYGEYINDTLFNLEHISERLRDTNAYVALRLNVGLVKDDLKKILQRDKNIDGMIGLN